MELAYKAEYEQSNITITQLLEKYEITLDDIPSHTEWLKEGEEPKPEPKPKTRKPRKKKAIDKILDKVDLEVQAAKEEPQTPIVLEPEVLDTDEELEGTEKELKRITEFKELALTHCITFMKQDAKFSEVKEFKDIVSIVDSLEKSYQKVDPDAGKPTINILVQNLMEKFQDDC